MKKIIENLKDLQRIQGADGNWNYSPYMHGMYNGMEIIMASLEGRKANFRGAPEQWGMDASSDEKPVAVKEG